MNGGTDSDDDRRAADQQVGLICPVCLEAMAADASAAVRTWPCMHRACGACALIVDNEFHSTCPICGVQGGPSRPDPGFRDAVVAFSQKRRDLAAAQQQHQFALAAAQQFALAAAQQQHQFALAAAQQQHQREELKRRAKFILYLFFIFLSLFWSERNDAQDAILTVRVGNHPYLTLREIPDASLTVRSLIVVMVVMGRFFGLLVAFELVVVFFKHCCLRVLADFWYADFSRRVHLVSSLLVSCSIALAIVVWPLSAVEASYAQAVCPNWPQLIGEKTPSYDQLLIYNRFVPQL
jgi:hypothetical protein